MEVTTELPHSPVPEAPIDVGLTPVEQRAYAAMYLEFLSQGRNEGYMTHARLGQLTNTSVHSATRTLSRLIRKGAIQVLESSAGDRRGKKYLWIHPNKAEADRQFTGMGIHPESLRSETSLAAPLADGRNGNSTLSPFSLPACPVEMVLKYYFPRLPDHEIRKRAFGMVLLLAAFIEKLLEHCAEKKRDVQSPAYARAAVRNAFTGRDRHPVSEDDCAEIERELELRARRLLTRVGAFAGDPSLN